MNHIVQEVKQRNWSVVKKLLQEEPSRIREKSEEGLTIPLMVSGMGDIVILKYIVENTLSRLEEKDSLGQNCLHYAAEEGNVESVRYLVEQVGFSLVEPDYTGHTPYDIVMEQGSKELQSYVASFTGLLQGQVYHNPIRTGMFPDPSIVRVGEDYYMVNSTFVFFPCLPISHSKDLVHWKVIGHAITRPEWAKLDDLEGGRGYWAPDISYYQGKFYITATLRYNDGGTILRRQIVVSSECPEGPYCEPAYIDEDGIDPSIFTDVDGRRYMLLNRGARIFELSEDATKKISEPRLLYYGDKKHATEGPHLLRKDDWYYLFLAEGGTGRGHQISVARAKELYGPYEACPFNPIMTQNESNALLQCCGHGKPVQTEEGEWYMVYLSYRFLEDKYGILGRETSMDPITWTQDGWPMVNRLGGPSSVQRIPSTKFFQLDRVDSSFVDDFTGNALDLRYIHSRPPEVDGVRISKGKLIIKGSKKEINTMEARNTVLIRQSDFNFTAEISMDIPELSIGQNAGMLAYYDENTFLKFGIFSQGKIDRHSSRVFLGIFEKIGDEEIMHDLDMDQITQERSNNENSVDKIHFKMEVCGLIRSFYYRMKEDWIPCMTLDHVSYLCSEGFEKGKRFTGATLGMYAVGGEEKELYTAFDSFSYVPLETR